MKITAPTTPTPVTPKIDIPAEPRNFLVAFLLTLVGGFIGLRNFYLGDKKIGWIRIGLLFGGYLWIIMMIFYQQTSLSLLGLTAVLVAMIWAVVDFFYVYFVVRTDHDGNVLVSTARDKRWAKSIFIITVTITILCIIMMVSLASFVENRFRSGMYNDLPGYRYQQQINNNSLNGGFKNEAPSY